jgi:hypothetical protein
MKNRNIMFITKLLALGFLALFQLPKAFGVVPAADGDYPGGNTAEGQDALLSLTTGGYNTAVGWWSLRAITAGRFCTGVELGPFLPTPQMKIRLRAPLLS